MAESVKKNQTSRLLEVRNSAGGQIVEVEGGHIIRSIGKKDRHSKVCTAKGPRDRRVRLSAHTAIQFYDVQDRLGYDRPSKAVDWLIKKAKSAIDELGVLPSAMVWQLPAATEEHSPNSQLRPRFEQASHDGQTHLNSDSIVVDTLKPFFPMAEVSSSQDLCLSLQSLKDSTTLLQPAQVHHSREQMYNPVSLESSMGVGWSSGQHSSTVGWLDQQSGGDQTISWYTTSPALSHQDQQQFSEYLSSQRGPLQSADFSSVSASLDHPTYQQSYSVDHPSTIGFSSFLFSAGSQCQEEGSHDMTNKFHLCPLSTSSTL